MNNQKLMAVLAQVHNSLYKMHVCEENIIILGDNLKVLRGLIDTLNQEVNTQIDVTNAQATEQSD